MNIAMEIALFDELSKLNRGTRRRLLRRTMKQYRASLKQWQKWTDTNKLIDAFKFNPTAYIKMNELWDKINVIQQLTLWFDEDSASKFNKNILAYSA